MRLLSTTLPLLNLCNFHQYIHIFCLRIVGGLTLGWGSGFGGLVVSMPVPKIAGSNPAEAVRFFGRKNPQHAFLRRGSKAVCPMSQICGMLKNPVIYVEALILSTDRGLSCRLAWKMTGGTKGGAQRACSLKA
jgi:hypothetical protein